MNNGSILTMLDTGAGTRAVLFPESGLIPNPSVLEALSVFGNVVSRMVLSS